MKPICHIKMVEFIDGKTVSPPKGWYETPQEASANIRQDIADAISLHNAMIKENQSAIDAYKKAEEELDKLMQAQESAVLA